MDTDCLRGETGSSKVQREGDQKQPMLKNKKPGMVVHNYKVSILVVEAES